MVVGGPVWGGGLAGGVAIVSFESLSFVMKTLFLITLSCLFANCNSSRPLLQLNDFETCKSEAQKQNTNIFIIFDLYGSPIRYVDKMLADDGIKKALENYVVGRLRCDDKTILKDSLTMGQYNSKLQEEATGNYYQPMFCFFDEQGNLITPPLGYSRKEVLLKYIRDLQIPDHKDSLKEPPK